MTHEEATKLLGIAFDTQPTELRKRYQELYSDYQIRLSNAPTPRLKELYQKNLQELGEAYKTLLNESTAEPYLDFPSLEPIYDIFAQEQKPKHSDSLSINTESVTKFVPQAGKRVISGSLRYVLILTFLTGLGFISWSILKPRQGKLIIKTDTDCIFYLDKAELFRLKPDEAKSLAIAKGAHLIRAESIDKKDHWEDSVQVKNSEQILISIPLQAIMTKRLAGEEAEKQKQRMAEEKRERQRLQQRLAEEQAERERERQERQLAEEKAERERRERQLAEEKAAREEQGRRLAQKKAEDERQQRLEKERLQLEERARMRAAVEALRPKAVIENIWVTHNVNYGMLIHIKMSASNLKGRALRASAFFFYETGMPVRGIDRNYTAPDGYCTSQESFIPSYDETTWSDFRIFMPYSALPATGLSRFLKFQVLIQSPDETLETSAWVNFQFFNRR